jgi:hypothetical protein
MTLLVENEPKVVGCFYCEQIGKSHNIQLREREILVEVGFDFFKRPFDSLVDTL